MLPGNHPVTHQNGLRWGRTDSWPMPGYSFQANRALLLALSQLIQQRLDLGDAPGRANYRRQDTDAGRLRR